ncbi:MAG TPA: DUF3090 family protein [Acidimicrobiales bacterium]|nr:DUF3090 family protein [Acidimicrobiales bacterium]
MSRSFELPEAEWATVGAVGEPGQRTFYIQARQGEQLLTLKLEKQQVAALAQFLGEILADLPVPEDPDGAGSAALEEPVLAEWAVGSIQLSYDGPADRVVVLAEEIGDEEDEEPDVSADPLGGRGAARIGLSRASAALIIRVGADLVSAGRPTCPLCGRPMDPEGHSCPRTNGHRPH